MKELLPQAGILFHPGVLRPLDLDECAAQLLTHPPAHLPLTHSFVPGFYIRTIFMPKRAIVVSHIHKTRNPYWVTKGKVEVQIDGVNQIIEAPFVGITEPGTQRLLFIHEDCEWTTFHPNPTDERDIETLERMLTEPHINHVVGIDNHDFKHLHPTMYDDLQQCDQARLAAGGSK